MKTVFKLKDETATLELAKQFAQYCPQPCIIFLQGELGAGKTTFVRGFLKALGYQAKVKSPTFTLVESYELGSKHLIFHFDLYRLEDPQELDLIGIRDYFQSNAICLIEWPERALKSLELADIELRWQVLEEGRLVEIETMTEKGDEIIKQLERSKPQ